jgi:hypothetical protein
VSALWIELDTAPLERARGDVAFVFFFQDERPLRGDAGRADWRLCGRLSALLTRERLTGAPGEAVLVPSGGGLRAPLLVALGAGVRGAFDEAAWERIAGDIARRSLLLRAQSAVLPLPPADERLGLRQRLEGLVAAAAAALAERPAADLLLRVVLPREDALRATELLRGYRPRSLPESVALHLSPGPDRELDRDGARPSV